MSSGATRRCVSLDPGRLDEVIDCIGMVGAATGTGTGADVLMAGPARPGGRGAARGPRATSGRGSSSWSGRTRPSTPGTGCPIRWRRPAASRSSPSPVPARAGSPGRRSPGRRSTSRSSCRVASTSRARWRRLLRSLPGPRQPVSAASSPSTPMRTSLAPGPGWWTGWSSLRTCCTDRPGRWYRAPGSFGPEGARTQPSGLGAPDLRQDPHQVLQVCDRQLAQACGRCGQDVVGLVGQLLLPRMSRPPASRAGRWDAPGAPPGRRPPGRRSRGSGWAGRRRAWMPAPTSASVVWRSAAGP